MEMPGGPQGTVLWMFLFLILINSARIKEVDMRLVENMTRANANAQQIISKMHAKYDDDLTVSEALKKMYFMWKPSKK